MPPRAEIIPFGIRCAFDSIVFISLLSYFMTSEIKTKDCDCCMWDDMGYKHEPSCSSITTQSAKELVLQFVREKNPQTMELKFGCVLRGTSGIEFLFLGCERWRGHDKINYWKAAYTLREYPFERLNSKAIKEPNMQTGMDEYTRDMLDSMNSSSNVCINGSSNDYKIIGSDMGLQELLIALDIEEYKVRADGWIVRGDGYGDYTSYALYDLTKNLHNQSDEFFTSLLPLING